ncbi:MAG: hypothetical protein AAF573_10105 [Bacteroidota bacterium]
MKKLAILTFLFSFYFAACQRNVTTSPYEYALLSAHVYDDDEAIPDLPDGWKPFLDFDEDEFWPTLDLPIGKYKEMADNDEWLMLGASVAAKFVTWGGYFGRAYLNEKTQQIVIAHRGTDLDLKLNAISSDHISLALSDGKIWDLLGDIDDDFEILNGKIPTQQLEAAEYFVGEVQKEFEKQYHSKPKIIHTGHSLGAILAELCAIKYNSKAVTFESPGSKPIAAQLPDNQSLNLENPDITIYNAEPNQINTLHEHLGKVVPLYDTSKQQLLESEDEKVKSLKQHPIKELLKRFDEKTGKPK